MRVGQHVCSESEKELVPLLSLRLQPRQRTRLLVSSQRSTSSRGSSRPCTHFRARNTANTTASTTQNFPKRKPRKIQRHHARRLLTFIGTSTAIYLFEILGLPRGRSDDSWPSCRAVVVCQRASPNGVPRARLWRSDLSSASVSTPFT